VADSLIRGFVVDEGKLGWTTQLQYCHAMPEFERRLLHSAASITIAAVFSPNGPICPNDAHMMKYLSLTGSRGGRCPICPNDAHMMKYLSLAGSRGGRCPEHLSINSPSIPTIPLPRRHAHRLRRRTPSRVNPISAQSLKILDHNFAKE
jgi:hypothetical protein